MKEELETLLNDNQGYQIRSRQTRSEIYEIVMNSDIDLNCLKLVNDFVNTHEHNYKQLNSDLVRKFCYDYILDKVTIKKYKDKRNTYLEDKKLQESLKAYKVDAIQYWFLLMFCLYYVETLTTIVPYKTQSIREQLKSIVDEITKMNFSYKELREQIEKDKLNGIEWDGTISDIDWRKAYPERVATITIEIENDSKIEIKDTQTIHLIATLIEQYLKKDHTKKTNEILDVVHDEYSRDKYKFLYLTDQGITLSYEKLTSGEGLSPQEEEYYRLIKANPSNSFDDKTLKPIALFKYFVIGYLKDSNKITGYKPSDGSSAFTKNKYFIISMILSILEYWKISKVSKENKSEITKRLVKLHEDERYLRTSLEGNDIKTEKDAIDYMTSIKKRENRA